MATLGDVVKVLIFAAQLASDTKECATICTNVCTRLNIIYATLHAMEQKKTLPQDDVVRDYKTLVNDFKTLLLRRKGQPWVYRVVSSKRMIGKVKNFQERINNLKLALDLCQMYEAADARAEQKRRTPWAGDDEKRLVQAISQDDVASVKDMISSVSINSNVGGGWNATPLIVAVAAGATEVTKMLLASGADPSAQLASTDPELPSLNDKNVTALHVAARAGNLSIVKALLNAKPDLVNALSKNHRTPLHFAAQFGHVDVISELLSRGANVDEQDSDTQRPLHWAAAHGKIDCARVLLKSKPDVCAMDSFGKSALSAAVDYGHVEIVQLLLDAGATVAQWDIQSAQDNGRLPILLMLT